VKFPWYSEVSSRVTRNAIDDLDNAFKHFFRRCKNGEKPGLDESFLAPPCNFNLKNMHTFEYGRMENIF
jgi:hypothetical protein